MILKKEGITTEVKSNYQVKQVQMGIDTKNIHKLLDMLSNIYTNPASFIREWVSNAWDAHIKAGKKDTPVIFRMLDTKVEVEDFGTGMGPEIVNNIVANFAASTKDEDPDQIGAYGIGINSGFAWKDGFELQDFYNGTKYHYLFSKDTAGYKIVLLYEQPTDRENGCIFSIEMYPNEQDKYESEIKKLIYFDNVVFEGKNEDFYNKYKVFKYNSFITSTAEDKNSELFILLNQVKYKLDWDQLDINRIVFPIGVIIPQNSEVIPTPTREGIYYTEGAVKLIKERIQLVKDELHTLYRKAIKEPLPLKEFIHSEYGVLELNDHISLQLHRLINNLDDYKLKGLEFFRSSDSYYRIGNLLAPIHTIYSISGYKATKTYDTTFRAVKDSSKLFFTTKNRLNSNRNSYIRSKLGYAYIAYYRKLSLFGSVSYYSILDLKKYPKEEWRSKIIQYQKFINNFITEYCYDYEAVVPPKKKQTITSNLVGRVLTGVDSSVKVYDFLNQYRKKKIIFSSDRDELNKWYSFYGSEYSTNLKLVHVSKKNEAMMLESDDKNLVHLDDKEKLLKYFMKGAAKLLASKLFSKYDVIFNSSEKMDLIYKLNPEVHEDFKTIKTLVEQVPLRKDRQFVDAVLAEAIASNKIDHTMLAVINRVRKVADNYEQLLFINYRRYDSLEYKERAERVAEKILRYDQIKERKRLLPYKKDNK